MLVSGNSQRKEKFRADLLEGDGSPKWPGSATEKHMDEGPVNEVRTLRIVILHARSPPRGNASATDRIFMDPIYRLKG